MHSGCGWSLHAVVRVVVSCGRSTNDQVDAGRWRMNRGILGVRVTATPLPVPSMHAVRPFGRLDRRYRGAPAHAFSWPRHARSELLVCLLGLAHQRVLTHGPSWDRVGSWHRRRPSGIAGPSSCALLRTLPGRSLSMRSHGRSGHTRQSRRPPFRGPLEPALSAHHAEAWHLSAAHGVAGPRPRGGCALDRFAVLGFGWLNGRPGGQR
jgi:hypothetical protein